jgi:hypothetical protein
MSDDQLEPWAQDFLRALGYLLVQSNMLEDALVDVYRVVTNKRWSDILDDVRDMTLGRLKGLVVDAYEEKFPDGELRQRLDRLKPELAAAVEARNKFVHASWAFDPQNESMERRRKPRKRGAAEEIRRLKTADVQTAYDLIGSAAEKLWRDVYDYVVEETPGNPGEMIQLTDYE